MWLVEYCPFHSFPTPTLLIHTHNTCNTSRVTHRSSYGFENSIISSLGRKSSTLWNTLGKIETTRRIHLTEKYVIWKKKKKKPSNLNELSKNFAAQSKAVHVTINCTSCSSLSWNMLQPRHKTSSHNSSIIQMYRTTHIAWNKFQFSLLNVITQEVFSKCLLNWKIDKI